MSIHLWSLRFSARRIVVNPARHLDGGSREAPGSTFPHGLSREAGGRQKRLRGAHVGFPNLGPPSSTWAVSVSLTGTRLGDRASTQRFLDPFGLSKSLIFLTQFKGCVRSVLVERAGLPRCPNLGSAQEGKRRKELQGDRLPYGPEPPTRRLRETPGRTSAEPGRAKIARPRMTALSRGLRRAW